MHGPSTRSRRLAVTLGLNVVLVAVQAVAGLLVHSMGLIADAGHNLTDVTSIAMSLVAVRWAMRPRSEERSFGNHRATVLAALANAIALAGVTGVVAVESIHRLLHPAPVTAGVVVAVAGGAFVINGAAALVLSDHRGDLNMRANLVHMAGDSFASLAVAAAGIAMLVLGGFWWLDPAAALAVGVVIVVEAGFVLRDSATVLLESTPTDVDLGTLKAVMAADDGVTEVHDLHVWSLSSEVRALSAHLVLAGHPSLEEAQVVSDRVKLAVAAPFAIAHATLELECERCTDSLGDPCLIDELDTGIPVRQMDPRR